MRTGLLSTGGTVAWKQVRGRRLQHCHAPILQATHVILALAPENSKARTLRSVVAHARRNRRRPRPSTLTEGDPNVQEILDNQYGVLTDEMLSQEPPGHRSGYMAIVGRPNAGKSTLLNALLGQKLSIVTAKAQTTRHRVLGIISEDDFQLICLDTPGIMQAEKNKLDETMMRSVKRATRDADVILALVDASNSPEEALEYMEPGKLWSNQPWALVLNKVDKVSESEVERLKELFEKSTSADIIVPTCAVSGRGVPAIRSWAADHIPEGSSFYPKDFVTEHPERFFVAEIIREKIFLLYREEVPYAATVRVTEFKERPAAKDFVQAEILVESLTQRAIILGAQGSAIKRLAIAARTDIELFLERPVYLELSVKVQPKWRKDAKALEQLGY